MKSIFGLMFFLIVYSTLAIAAESVDVTGTWKYDRNPQLRAILYLDKDGSGMWANSFAGFGFKWKLVDNRIIFDIKSAKNLDFHAKLLPNNTLVVSSDGKETEYRKVSDDKPEFVKNSEKQLAKHEKKLEEQRKKSKEHFEQNFIKTELIVNEKKQLISFVNDCKSVSSIFCSLHMENNERIFSINNSNSKFFTFSILVGEAGKVVSGITLSPSKEKYSTDLKEIPRLTESDLEKLKKYFDSNQLKLEEDFSYQRDRSSQEIVYYSHQYRLYFNSNNIQQLDNLVTFIWDVTLPKDKYKFIIVKKRS